MLDRMLLLRRDFFLDSRLGPMKLELRIIMVAGEGGVVTNPLLRGSISTGLYIKLLEKRSQR